MEQKYSEAVHQIQALIASPSDEVENESKGDADREGGQCAFEEGQEDEGEAEPDEDGNEAGEGRVPVPVAARLANL